MYIALEFNNQERKMMIVKICKIHGELSELQVLREKNSTSKQGFTLRCHQCRLEKDRRWKENNREIHRTSASAARNKARKDYREGIISQEPKANSWERKDRKENPEKYRKYEANFIAKHGIEYVRKMEVARIHGLTIDKYDELHTKQNGLCEICKNPETRLSRTKKEVMPLCLDHCHECKDKGQHIIRGLLCNNCNSAMGKLHDDIDILKSMISYLEAHKHVE